MLQNISKILLYRVVFLIELNHSSKPKYPSFNVLSWYILFYKINYLSIYLHIYIYNMCLFLSLEMRFWTSSIVKHNSLSHSGGLIINEAPSNDMLLIGLLSSADSCIVIFFSLGTSRQWRLCQRWWSSSQRRGPVTNDEVCD